LKDLHFLILHWRQVLSYRQSHIYAYDVFQSGVHFQQFHLNQGRICNEFTNVYFLLRDWRRLWFRYQLHFYGNHVFRLECSSINVLWIKAGFAPNWRICMLSEWFAEHY
jgi:hypothetical protein